MTSVCLISTKVILIIKSSQNLKYLNRFYQAVDWNGNNWALRCNFTGNGLQRVSAQGEQCGSLCANTNGCTHWSFINFNGGTCCKGHKKQNFITYIHLPLSNKNVSHYSAVYSFVRQRAHDRHTCYYRVDPCHDSNRLMSTFLN